MLVPKDRALRFFVASDGLWDLMAFDKCAKAVRAKLPLEVRCWGQMLWGEGGLLWEGGWLRDLLARHRWPSRRSGRCGPHPALRKGRPTSQSN